MAWYFEVLVHRLLLVFVLISVLLPGLVWAQEEDANDKRAQLRQWLDELADHDAAVREAARLRLMGMSREDLETFREVIAQAQPLLPSQAVTLREIVLQAYAAAEPYEQDRTQGFLGVELRTAPLPSERPEGTQPSGVLIVNRLLGFCGYRMLQEGDIVLGVVDQSNARTGAVHELSTLIRNIPAGTTINLEVYRRGQIIIVPVTLDARPVDLAKFQNLDALRAIRFRRAYDYWREHFAPLVEQGVS